ncbi:hypothetical protein [Pelagibacterium sp. H642]|uniref:hypothetical protein n=1 Tax=Pelagibacterium sp. H642 TaxID=1881069 RepID=UPI002814AC5C|nr:hypothetical protein [Pelagibacterium sp. H642]WMT90171.1 hypothetical protein NO934_15440 [Pelagibacterium sp. H642]
MVDLTTSHYSTGTASVADGGTVVTGHGTAWSGAVRPGDLFGTHVGLPIRILSVDSNTSLTLAHEWPGATQTASAYEIQRTPYDVGYRKAIEDLVTGIAEGNLPMFAALVAAANKLPYFDSSASMAVTDLSAFARTLLDDASAASARNTLDVAQKQENTADATVGRGLIVGAFGLGGDGETIPDNDYNKAVRTGFYRGPGAGAVNGPPRTAIYGTLIVAKRSSSITQIAMIGVAGSAIPNIFAFRGSNDNGASWSPWADLVPEYGSNANGSYVRFPDGTQICFVRFTPAALVWTQSSAGNYYSESYVLNWPATFASSPLISTGSEDYRARNCDALIGGYGLDYCSVYFTSQNNSTAGSNPSAHLIAIGRWF